VLLAFLVVKLFTGLISLAIGFKMDFAGLFLLFQHLKDVYILFVAYEEMVSPRCVRLLRGSIYNETKAEQEVQRM